MPDGATATQLLGQFEELQILDVAGRAEKEIEKILRSGTQLKHFAGITTGPLRANVASIVTSSRNSVACN